MLKQPYQMALTELSRDTLKVLGDLRKAITEEIAKVMETTRQIIGALAGALAIGLGLIAARMTASTNPILIIAVMLVVVAYVAATIVSGFQFVRLQRGLRQDWKPRLYRFIPESEYVRMVTNPAARAEAAFFVAAGIGAIAIGLLTLVVVCTAFLTTTPAIPASASNVMQPSTLPTDNVSTTSVPRPKSSGGIAAPARPALVVTPIRSVPDLPPKTP